MDNKNVEPLKLKPEEQKLFDEIEQAVQTMRDTYGIRHAGKSMKGGNKPLGHDELLKMQSDNAQRCFKLHRLLKRRGYAPIHSKYMLKNRGASTSESFEFYNHFHPQEDLVKFVKNPSANVAETNPVDTTLGEEFNMPVYTKRWGHYDTYTLTRTIDGWNFKFFGISGPCDKEGHPFLYKNLEHDFVSYPSDLKYYISSIWSRADQGASKEDVQNLFDKVSRWISLCEEKKPEDDVLI